MEFYQAEETSHLRTIISWIVDLIVVIALAFYMVHCFGNRVTVNGGSMSPTLASGDVVLLNRLSYTLREPERFEVVAFEREGSGIQIKRIIGLPGETIQIRDSQIYIDGEPLKAEDGLSIAAIAGLAEYPIELGADEYFLLGDNRDSSEDSRFSSIRNVKRGQLIGRIWLKLEPLSELRLV